MRNESIIEAAANAILDVNAQGSEVVYLPGIWLLMDRLGFEADAVYGRVRAIEETRRLKREIVQRNEGR